MVFTIVEVHLWQSGTYDNVALEPALKDAPSFRGNLDWSCFICGEIKELSREDAACLAWSARAVGYMQPMTCKLYELVYEL